MSIIKIFNRQKYKPTTPTKTSFLNTYEYGQRVTAETSLEVAAFYRGLFYISSQIAKLPWDIKTFDNRILNSNNEVYYLLNRKPNDEMTAFHWKALMVYACHLRGNGFSEIVRDATRKIRAIYPIMHHDVCMVRDLENKLLYQMSSTVDGGVVYLRPDEVLHFRNVYTEDGINGLSVINYANKVLGTSKGADKMAGKLFENSGMPSGVLQTDRVLSEDVIERLKKDWRRKFGGNNAGGVAVLEEGMQFNPINFAPDVMQFLESRQYSVLEIARFLSVPPSKLYVPESQTYNNIEHSNIEVGNDTIDVWARVFEQEVDIKLLGNRRVKSEMDLHQLYRGDMDTRSSYFSTMISNAAMTPNEARKKEGLEPYDGGDEFYIATNNLTPVSRQNEIIDSQIDNNQPSQLEQAITNKLNKKR